MIHTKIFKIKDWLEHNHGEQFRPLEYNSYNKELITSVLRLKDDKIFEWLNPIYHEAYEIEDFYFTHIVRIHKFHEDKINVDLFIGFWDLDNHLWLSGDTEKLPINNIDDVVGERMNTNYTKYIKSQLKSYKAKITIKT